MQTQAESHCYFMLLRVEAIAGVLQILLLWMVCSCEKKGMRSKSNDGHMSADRRCIPVILRRIHADNFLVPEG